MTTRSRKRRVSSDGGYLASGLAVALSAITVTLLLVSCRHEQPPSTADRRVSKAEAVVDSYLHQALVTAETPVESTLFSCEPEGPTNLELALASHRVLGSLLSGDTAVVSAQVVTVARVELTLDDTLDVRQEIKTDTLSWVLTHSRPDSSWGICGYSREGVGFVRLRALGSKVRWVGGTSLRGILGVAESVANRN